MSRFSRFFATAGLGAELIVDNFAGGGGASTGIWMATGRQVDHAVNHSWEALGMHRINHPRTIHHCEDVYAIDPETMCEGRPVGLAHFSPDCKHFSKAKGGQPLDKRIRGLVLVMLKWAKYGARVMTMENVEEITTWGPLIQATKNGVTGWYPDPEHKGRTWQAFLSIISTGIDPEHPDLPDILEVLGGGVTKEECVQGFGYQYEARELRACDYGSPTIRRRLYGVFRCDGRPIVFPEPTHYNPARGAVEGQQPWRTVAEQIDWSQPCHSIFLDKAEAKRVRCKRPLARATLRRVATGIDRYVLKAEEPFIVSLTHAGGERVESVNEPSRVITGAHRGEKALVAPSLSRFNVMAGGGGKTGVVAAYLAQHNGGFNGSPGHPADEPVSTISARGSQQTVVACSAAAYYGSERDGQAVSEPARAVTTKPRLGFVESTAVAPMTEEQIDGARRVAAFLRAHGVQFEGEFATVEGYVLIDIGMRMLTPRELFRCQGFSDGYVIDRAWVIDPQTGALTEIRLTKEQQIRMCGNSVCPQVMEALVRANVPELARRETEELVLT